MARIEQVFASGTIAGVIFYERNGKPCARSLPSRVRHTAATKNESKLFGRSKTISRLLRQSLSSLLIQYRSQAVMHRVDKGVMGWMRTVQSAGGEVITLPGFSCTGEEEYNKLLQLNSTTVLSGTTLQVTIPSIEKVYTPAGSNKAVLTLVVSCIDPQGAEVLRNEEQKVEIGLPPVAGEATVVSFEVVVQEGVFIILSAGLSFLQLKGGKEVVMDKPDPKPVAVVEGWYPRQ